VKGLLDRRRPPELLEQFVGAADRVQHQSTYRMSTWMVRVRLGMNTQSDAIAS
jgi:hypothetical protein